MEVMVGYEKSYENSCRNKTPEQIEVLADYISNFSKIWTFGPNLYHQSN